MNGGSRVSEALLPSRPSLPAAFLASLCVFALDACLLCEGRHLQRDVLSGILAATFLAASASFVVTVVAHSRRKKCIKAISAVCCIILLGAVSASWATLRLQEDAYRLTAESAVNGTIELLEDARTGSYAKEALAQLSASGKSYRVYVRFENEPDDGELRYGDVYSVSGTLSEPGFATSGYLWGKGACASLKAKTAKKVAGELTLKNVILVLRNNALDGFDAEFARNPQSSQNVSLVAGLSCGYRSNLFDTALYRAVRKCGLAHLVAVSGAHLVIVVSTVSLMMRACKVGRFASIAVNIAVMLAYLLLSGMPVSAIRATVMSVICASSFFAKRRASSLNALGVCALVMLLCSPFSALSVSLQLSYLSTAGILVFNNLFASWVGAYLPHAPKILVDLATLTLSSNLVCLPYSVSLFNQLPLISLAANIVCGIIFPFLCLASLLVALMFSLVPLLARITLFPLLGFAGVFSGVVEVLAKLPFSCIPFTCTSGEALGATLIFSVLLWMVWPAPSVRFAATATAVCALTLVIFLFASPLLAGTRIVMLDVGQGDALLLQSKGKNLLIDTGNKSSMLAEALARNGVRKLDAVLITHADDDHCGSLAALSSYATIDKVLLAEGVFSCNCKSCTSLLDAAQEVGGVEALSQGDVVVMAEFSLQILWPAEFEDEGGNVDSICALAKADVDSDGVSDCNVLLTGDAEVAQIESALDECGNDPIDILKVAHHGSRTGTDETLAKRIAPRIALVSVGENNRYGHPHEEVLQALDASGAQLFRTDTQGDVSCRIERGALSVRTQR